MGGVHAFQEGICKEFLFIAQIALKTAFSDTKLPAGSASGSGLD